MVVRCRMAALTARQALAAGLVVTACCGGCDRATELDLATLPPDRELLTLPLRCSACGSRRFTVACSGHRLAGY
jgi:hypothetical protein